MNDASIDALLLCYYAEPPAWDVLIISDGAGSGWDGPIGWSGLLYDRWSAAYVPMIGCETSGTITRAELQPFISLLALHRARIFPDSWKGNRLASVLAFSDNLSVVNCANGGCLIDANQDMWRAYQTVTESRYRVVFHHLQRDLVPAHKLMDQLSASARVLARDVLRTQLPNLAESFPEKGEPQ